MVKKSQIRIGITFTHAHALPGVREKIALRLVLAFALVSLMAAAASTHTAVVLGASGNVGALIVRSLLADATVANIKLFTRRRLDEYASEPRIRCVLCSCTCEHVKNNKPH